MLDRRWRRLYVVLAAWLQQREADTVAYLIAENQTLRAQLGRQRLRLTDGQRRRLAILGHRLGRERLRTVATLVTPDTILRWHRQLVARKWTYARRFEYWDITACEKPVGFDACI